MAEAMLVFTDDDEKTKTRVELLFDPPVDSLKDMSPAQETAYNVCMQVRDAMKFAGSNIRTHIMDGEPVS